MEVIGSRNNNSTPFGGWIGLMLGLHADDAAQEYEFHHDQSRPMETTSGMELLMNLEVCEPWKNTALTKMMLTLSSREILGTRLGK